MVNPFAPSKTKKSKKSRSRKLKKSVISAEAFLARQMSGKLGAFKSITRHAAESGLGEAIVAKKEEKVRHRAEWDVMSDDDVLMHVQVRSLSVCMDVVDVMITC